MSSSCITTRQLLFQQLLPIELGVQAAVAHERVVRTGLRNPAMFEHDNLIGAAHRRHAMRHDDDVRWRMTPDNRCRISSSVWVSTADNASSRTRIAGDMTSARAIAVRCFCPPESVIPRSPTSVS